MLSSPTRTVSFKPKYWLKKKLILFPNYFNSFPLSFPHRKYSLYFLSIIDKIAGISQNKEPYYHKMRNLTIFLNFPQETDQAGGSCPLLFCQQGVSLF